MSYIEKNNKMLLIGFIYLGIEMILMRISITHTNSDALYIRHLHEAKTRDSSET